LRLRHVSSPQLGYIFYIDVWRDPQVVRPPTPHSRVKRFVEIQLRRSRCPAGDIQRQVIKNVFYNGCQYYLTIPVFYIIKCTS